jgi:hypothetical protein
VNYLHFEIYNGEEDKITYKNSWITNHAISGENVRGIEECGRARWKTGNEHNNLLKRRGYNMKHNFGHGENHANGVFCPLNLQGVCCTPRTKQTPKAAPIIGIFCGIKRKKSTSATGCQHSCFTESRPWRAGITGGPGLFLGGRTTFSGHYVTGQRVTRMKPGMICSLPFPAMSLTVEFGIAGQNIFIY